MKSKIILPMVAILTALVIVTTVFSTIKFTEFTSLLFNERIAVGTNGLKAYLASSGQNSRFAAVSASIDINVIAAINNRDRDEIIHLLTAPLSLYYVDFYTVTDEAGVVLARTHAPEYYGDSVINQKNIQEALNNNIYTCVEEGTVTKISVRTGAPVYNSDGAFIGVISAGVRLDTNETLDRLKEHYNAEFSIFHNGTRISTTISANGERIIGSPLDPDVAEYINTHKKEYFGNVDILGINYGVAYLPLINGRDEVFAVIALGLSNSNLLLEKNSLQNSVIAIGVLGLFISIAILLIISSQIVKPVNRLTHLVSEVTHGNMNVDVVRTKITNDEIGILTQDIHSLIDVIKFILHDLLYLTLDLNKFGSIDLKIDTNKYSGSYKEIIGGIMKLADSVSIMRKTMAIMDYLDVMISVVDFDYNLLYLNSNMANVYGTNRENYIGEKCYRALKKLDQPCTFCHLTGLLREKDPFPSIDYDGIFDETSGRYIGGRAAIIRWVDGARVFFNSIKDETTKMEYQEQLRGAIKAAEAASVAKSAFLANMSHEIRTPMNSIIGFSELALDSETTPKTREYLNMIKENTNWLLQIINDILDISKVESGNVELEKIPFDLLELLNSCRSIILPRAVEKKVSLQFYAESSINKKLLGDPTKLRQILLNLLSNAVKFTDSGSVKMSVSAKNKTNDRIALRFEVKDSGIGMTGEQIKRIFEPFMQADISTTRKYGGTGLGMTITKNLLDIMGSRLEIESEPGTGTAIGFDLKFDYANSDDNPDTKEKTTEASNTAGKIDKPQFEGDILVCEDNQMNQRVITGHLARVGLKTEIAENGQEGINKVRARIDKGIKPFDLIFMDIHMPVMDGMETTPKIIELGTGTPIVAMTANIMTDDRELYKTAGMIDYVGKPFTSQELWRCLLKFLKPVSFTAVTAGEKEDGETKLQIELKTDFVKGNQTRYEEILNAIHTGDIKLAHRLAHSLKTNAAMIGMSALQKAALEVETALKGEENRVAEAQMSELRKELASALDELSPYMNRVAGQVLPETSAVYDADKARELMKKLEPLLQSGNPESLKMIEGLREIPGSGELIQKIEDFNFRAAATALEELKKILEKNTNDGSVKQTNEPPDRRTIIAGAVNKALDIFSRNNKTFNETLASALSTIAGAVDVDRIVIYRKIEINRENRLKQIYRWDREAGGLTATSIKLLPNNESIKNWQNKLMQDRFVNQQISDMTEDEAAFLKMYDIKSIWMIPVFNYGKIWGTIFFQDHKHERRFDENCADLIHTFVRLCTNFIIQADSEHGTAE